MRCELCGCETFNGTPERQYRACVGCGAMERHRALWRHLKDSVTRAQKVVEVSPLNARVYREFLEQRYQCSFIGIDKWKRGNPHDPRDVAHVDMLCDVCEMHVKLPDKVDLVIMQHVIEEVPDYLRGLKSIASSLIGGGTAFLEIPYQLDLKEHKQHSPDHFGNLWTFSFEQLVDDLNRLFTDVTVVTYEEAGVRGSFYRCVK